MIDKSILANYPIERVSLANGGDVTSQLMSWVLSPKNLERLKNNKDLVRKLTKMKALPSSVRLYIRNLAGVSDKITEDFFNENELAEIKKRVAEAEASGSMGLDRTSGHIETHGIDNIIGYQLEKGKLSLKKAFTDPATNIDMTLGQAIFRKDDQGNIKVIDKHDFGTKGGGSFYEGEYFPNKPKIEQAVPHPYEEGSIMDTLVGGVDVRRSVKVEESQKQMLKRAKKALDEGKLGAAKYARIIAGVQQGDAIPVEIDIGKISHEDKLKADPYFARYIAQDTQSMYGGEYEDVGIPTLIREQARKYLK